MTNCSADRSDPTRQHLPVSTLAGCRRWFWRRRPPRPWLVPEETRPRSAVPASGVQVRPPRQPAPRLTSLTAPRIQVTPDQLRPTQPPPPQVTEDEAAESDAEDVPADLWRGGTGRFCSALAALGSAAPWPTAREMLRDLLATDVSGAGAFVDRRATALLMLGDPAAAVDVADEAGRPLSAEALFLSGEEQRACAATLPRPSGTATAAAGLLACRLFAATDGTADAVTEFAIGLSDASLSQLVMSGAIAPFHRLVLAAAAAERSAALSGNGQSGESRPERRQARLFATAATGTQAGAWLYGIATLVKAAAEANPLLTAAVAAAVAPLLEPAAIRGLDSNSRIMAARIAIAGGAVDTAAAMLVGPENRPDVLSTAIAADPELTALSLVAFQEPSAVLGRELRTIDISAGLVGSAREVVTATIGLFLPEALPSPDPAASAVEDAVAPVPAVWFVLRAAADAGRLEETAALSLVLLEARPEIGAIGLATALEGFRLAGFNDESRRLAVEMMIATGVVSGLAPGV